MISKNHLFRGTGFRGWGSVILVTAAITGPGPTLAQAPPEKTDTENPRSSAALGTTIEVPSSPPVQAPADPQPPFVLNPQQEQRLKLLLHHWENESRKVKTFSCRFERYTYDTVFGPPRDPKSIHEGVIRYSAPDKGEFRVEGIREYAPPKEEGGAPQYIPRGADDAEHWICDGFSVFELNGKVKQLIERKLPPHMQGREIAEGPLPFIFGATQAKIEARYWLRELVPPADRAEYCFEAYPRRAEDALSFQRVRVILDQRRFLPQALEVFPPGYDGVRNLSREVYRFDHHEVNSLVQNAQQFLHQFISPKVPRGWKKVVENFAPADAEEVPQAASRMGPDLPPGYQRPR
ncbi:MAG TPA: TIGR03009 domain-containing protein [Pirellulaceae bacterium]